MRSEHFCGVWIEHHADDHALNGNLMANRRSPPSVKLIVCNYDNHGF